MKRICLLVIVGLGVLSIPTYISGMSSIMAVSSREGVTENLINSHYNWSLYALLILIISAGAAVTSGCGLETRDARRSTRSIWFWVCR
jgi:hypothetical protein